MKKRPQRLSGCRQSMTQFQAVRRISRIRGMRARHLRLRRRELGGSRLGRRGHGNLRLRSKIQLQVVTVRRRIQRTERARRFTAGTEEAQHLKPWTEEAGSSSVGWRKLGYSRLRGRYVGSCTYI